MVAIAALVADVADLREDETTEAPATDAVQQKSSVPRCFPADVEAGARELLDLRGGAEVGEASGVLADDPDLVDRQDEVACEVLEVLDFDQRVALVHADLP